jgi:hypothetical protein
MSAKLFDVVSFQKEKRIALFSFPKETTIKTSADI